MSRKIEVRKVALSDRAGMAMFRRMSAYAGGSGIVETHLFQDLAYESEENVAIERLDALVDLINRNVVLKIDVEGHEYAVLRGAERILRNNSGILQIEIHETSPNASNVFDLLEQIGWAKLIRIGWDYYFSNLERYKDECNRLAVIEEALSFIVEQNLNSEKPARRELIDGVTVEFSRKRAEQLKRILAFPSIHRRA